MSFSAHADEEQLLSYLIRQKLDTLISVHGEAEAIDSFTAQANKNQVAKSIVRPRLGEKVQLYGH